MDRKATMDQFDQAFEELQHHSNEHGPTSVLLLGASSKTIDAIRACLEVVGHTVVHASSTAGLEESLRQGDFGLLMTTIDATRVEVDQVFASVSLVSPQLPIIGFSNAPSDMVAIEFIRKGGVDFFSIPSELEAVAERIQAVLQKSRETIAAEKSIDHALKLCDSMNEERHRVVEENDSLSNKLANAHCDTQRKIRQVAIGAEFQTLVGQELEVESMLRTALGYMLTRVGAMNAAVYLREGDVDWGVGAFINYDRQNEQFQSLVDTLGPAICPTIACEFKLKRHADGESFASLFDVDSEDFCGNEVVTLGCFHEKRCMAVMILFRSDTRPFDSEALETIDTLRSIFGQQLGTILKIHRRAETQWPSESVDDDDWTLGKAA